MDEHDESPTITQLDAKTVDRIAAGEVVERPASVVKELVENSLDAGASRITVAVQNGGKDGIRVRDDGRGIPEAELSIAVKPHTTSKIRKLADLEAGVGTLGFRGEALSTIASVSRLTLRSKPRDAVAGEEVHVEGGDIGETRPAGCPTGTTVVVDDLFYNTPARKKFLKKDATEFDHINTVVTQYALANSDVAVSLEHNNRERFATDGSGNLQSAILSIYGREVAESMLSIDVKPDVDGITRIHGMVSNPETNRSTREYLATFVNSRYVTASILRDAVISGYGGQLSSDRYPFAVLFVTVPPDRVDVNVHPRKLDVRFDAEEAVTTAIETAVETALVDAGLIRSTAPRGRSAPEETTIAPTSQQPTEGTEVVGGAGTKHQTAAAEQKPTTDTKTAQTTHTSRSASDEDTQQRTGDHRQAEPTETEPKEPTESAQTTTPDQPHPTEHSEGTDSQQGDQSVERVDPSDPAAWEVTASTTASSIETPETTDSRLPGENGEPNRESESSRQDTEPNTSVSRSNPVTQQTLAGSDATASRSYESLPALRLLGQLYETYIVAESPTGLVLIDQHAADERVNYERLQHAFEGQVTAQALATPVELELTAREASLFEAHSDSISSLGFAAERIDDRWIRVSQVPAVFSKTLSAELLQDVLVSFVESTSAGEKTVGDVADELLADLACYPSVTGNTSLTEGSMFELVEALDSCKNPYACPHGRPTIIKFDRTDIEDRFERDYPGHAGDRRKE